MSLTWFQTLVQDHLDLLWAGNLVWVVCYMPLTWLQTLVQDHLDLLWAGNVDDDVVGMVLHQDLAWIFSSILGGCKV